MDESLFGIPNIGPSRRAALEAAGITARSRLKEASVEQLVSVTGMPRATAVTVLDFLRLDGAQEGNGAPPPPIPEAPVSPGPAVAEAPPEPPAEAPPEPPAEAPPEPPAAGPPDTPVAKAIPPPQADDGADETVDVRTDLDRAILRLQTVLSDASPDDAPKLDRQLTRLAARIEVLPRHADRFKPKQTRRLIDRLEALAARLQSFNTVGRPPREKARERLREIVREERRRIEDLVASSSPAREKPEKKGKK